MASQTGCKCYVCISGQKKLQSCQQSAGKNSDRNKVVTGSWKPENRYYGDEHGRNGCDRCSILFPGYYDAIGLTASDFVWQGFEQGEKDGCKEWPIPNASTLSWQGKPLPYMPFVYEHPVYWQKIEEETKGSGDITRSTCLFIDSEKARPHTEEEMVKVENIKGRLFLIGADDDSFWEAGKYVRRMDQRLKEHPHTCEYDALVYEHGTHFVLPETLLRIALPVGLKFVLKFVFKAAKDYPKECEATRKDIDRRLSAALKEWTAD